MSENTFSLIVCIPGEAPARHDLGGDAVTFGRSPENDIQILVAEVSVKHGRLAREGDTYRIVDSGSTNGTQVNGASVGGDGALLKPMDRVVVGTVVPAFFVPVAALAATPVEELVASLESAAKSTTPKTAPISVAAVTPASPVRAAVPVAVSPPASPGGATVKLDQVRPPVAPAKPAALSPKAPGAVPVAPAAPGAPQPLRPPGVAPATPVAPGGVKPGAPQPLRPPGVAPAAPSVPLPKTPPKPGQ